MNSLLVAGIVGYLGVFFFFYASYIRHVLAVRPRLFVRDILNRSRITTFMLEFVETVEGFSGEISCYFNRW